MTRVMIVEDTDLLRELLAEELQDHGLDVVVARNGEEALHVMMQCTPDVVVTDIRMPGALDGWALAERLREVNPSVGVVYTSGFTDLERPVPRSRFVGKPYRIEDVVTAIRAALPA